MHLSQKHPQFKEKTGFFLITGKQDGYIYKIHNGEVIEIDHVKIKNPEYSDNEGFFKTGGHGQVLQTGSSRDDKQEIEQQVIKEFISAFKKAVEKATSKEKAYVVYLFTPDYMKESINDALPASVQKNITMKYFGNFTHVPVSDLVNKAFNEGARESIILESGEANKILHKTDK